MHRNNNTTSSNHTIRSLKQQQQQRQRRRRQRRPMDTRTGPFLLTGMACVTMVVLWSVGALLLATYSHYMDNSSTARTKRAGTTTSSLLRLQDGRAFPSEFWDVWPDSSNLADGMESLFESCYPADDPEKCQIITLPKNSKTKKRRIAIIRLPGKLGALMETFLQDLLATWNDTTDDGATNEAEGIQFVPTADASIVNLHEQQQQKQRDDYENEDKAELPIAQIIRPVVLPPLLEALDLMLQTQNVDETTGIADKSSSSLSSSSLPTMEELQAVLQQVLRWHCRVAQQTEHRARMTILLDETTIYPKVIGKDVGNFLNLSFDEVKNEVNSMNDLSVQLLQRLGQAWHLARDIWENSMADSTFTIQLSKEEWVQRIVQNELTLQKDRTCLSPLDVYPKTRVTELVGTFLSGKSTSTVCYSYPESILCQEKSRQS